MKKSILLLIALFSLSLITKAQSDSTSLLPTCESNCYNKYVNCVAACCPYGGCANCHSACVAEYAGCLAGCGPSVRAKVLKIRDGMAKVKAGHNYGWIEDKEGLRKGQRIMITVTDLVKR